MSSIIELAIVDDNIDPKGIGRIRLKSTGSPSGPIERGVDYKPWDLNDPFIAIPFLPTNINYIPSKGQTVKIITYDPENKLINKEYIAGPFTTVHDFQSQVNARQVENTTYGTSVKQMNNIFYPNGNYIEPKSKSTLSNFSDYAIYGPYGSDVLLTENGITLRGGKLKSKQGSSDEERSIIMEYPILAEKRSILSLKKFGTKQEFVDVETNIITLPSKKLSYVIEYSVSSTDTNNSSFTINWYVYEVKDIFGDTFNTRVFGPNSVQNLYSYSDKVKLLNDDNTLTTPTFTQSVNSYELAYVTIRNTLCELHSEGIKKFNRKLRKINLHPFFYRPVSTLTDRSFLEKIKPGCFSTPTYGSGLVFSLTEINPKPITETKNEKILKTVSTTIEQSFGTLFSDKIYLISSDTNSVKGNKIPFDKLDTYEYTQEDLLTRIEPNTYSTVRGETLLEYLAILTEVIAGHAHQPGKPMVKNGYAHWDRLSELRKTLENDLLNKSIRIN